MDGQVAGERSNAGSLSSGNGGAGSGCELDAVGIDVGRPGVGGGGSCGDDRERVREATVGALSVGGALTVKSSETAAAASKADGSATGGSAAVAAGVAITLATS